MLFIHTIHIRLKSSYASHSYLINMFNLVFTSSFLLFSYHINNICILILVIWVIFILYKHWKERLIYFIYRKKRQSAKGLKDGCMLVCSETNEHKKNGVGKSWRRNRVFSFMCISNG